MRQVVLCIETTGLEIYQGHRIVEIGCVELVNQRLTGRFYHQYINPQRKVDALAFEQHGISDAFLSDKPIFSEIAKDALEFLESDEIIVYDAAYVMGFLKSEMALWAKPGYTDKLKNKITDVLVIGSKRHPKQNNSLDSLCSRYYVDKSQTELHGALLTAEILADLFVALENENTKQITADLSRYEIGENLTIVKTFSEFDAAIEGIRKTALCRGVSNHEYPLLPSLFRHADVESAGQREHNLMWVFKTHARAHLESTPSAAIEWLTIAQHHGLPTRLLDWSLSPLVACFFAVQSLSQADGAIYIYDIGKFKKEEDINVSSLKEIVAFFPSHATKRVTAQSGMFTVHPTKKMKLESTSIKKILIPAEKKKYFMEKLVKYGIHQATMFPDLDGLSNYLKYLNNYR